MIEVWHDTVKDNNFLLEVYYELMAMLIEDLNRTPYNHPITYTIDNLFDFDSAIIDKFKETVVVPTIEKYMNSIGDSLDNYNVTYKAWVAKYKDGRHIPSHNHPDSQISSVFYLMSEELNKGGEIVFTDGAEEVSYFPGTGDIVVFPSSLYHQTTPFYGSMRVVLPVDVFLN